MKYIIEGIDCVGKDTLINQILQNEGHHFVLHFSKPQECKFYSDLNPDSLTLEWQKHSFHNLMVLMDNPSNMIFNRSHLGEYVYAPLYRNYSGDYVFKLEEKFNVDEKEDVKLILLTTSNFDILKKDGNNLGPDDAETLKKEQDMFIEAFNKSNIKDKVIIDVYDDMHMIHGDLEPHSYFKPPQEIYKEMKK